MKPKLIFAETTPVERVYLKRNLGSRYALSFFEEPLEKIAFSELRGAQALSVFIYSKVRSELMKKIPTLKLVATRSTGFDHVDTRFTKSKKIAVCNVPFYGENTVAEHTFALILALSRKTHEGYLRTIRGNFSYEGLQGFDLKGKTIGIIGTGHIGLHAIRIAKGFGMKVIAYDVRQNEFMAETLGYSYAPFETVLEHSDILSLHAPYNPKTHHMINLSNIGKIKKGALLINTARGGLIETEALAKALDEGILAGAGLDVLEGEDLVKEERQILAKEFSTDRLKTLIQNHILLNRDNVIITPHLAFNSKEAFQRILDTTIQNIDAFFSGKPSNLIS